MKKAFNLLEVDNAVKLDVPVGPEHPFYTDFSKVRGDFQEKQVYKLLNVSLPNYTYNAVANQGNKTLLFLAGMRGSGKTSELEKYVNTLEKPDCFFCVVCNIDKELDMNDVEYMDILIFQLEKLIAKADKNGVIINKDTLVSLQSWFSERVNEINTQLKGEVTLETGASAEGGFFSFLKIFGSLKAGLTGSKERATTIRTTFKNRFPDFAAKFNELVAEVNHALRRGGIAQELLFVVDGLEKTMSTDTRRKIIMEESNRLQQIQVNTIFTLPIELMKERQRLTIFSKVVSFPFVKLIERGGNHKNQAAIDKFKEFVYKRIDASLFDSEATVERAICMSGGSPRELLRILEYANVYADETIGKITIQNMESAISKLAAESSRFLTKEDLATLKLVDENNKIAINTPYDGNVQNLLEQLILMEYNDGSYMRVNPLIEESAIYQQYVGS